MLFLINFLASSLHVCFRDARREIYSSRFDIPSSQNDSTTKTLPLVGYFGWAPPPPQEYRSNLLPLVAAPVQILSKLSLTQSVAGIISC